MTRIVCISDTHGLHEQVSLPEGDLLIHAGDFTNVGETWDVARFAVWLADKSESYKYGSVVIAGNHDKSLDEQNAQHPGWDVSELFGVTKVVYLRDSGVTINGLNIWGSPVTPSFGFGWAFNRHKLDIKPHWTQIPSDTNILVTHGPPFSVLDEPGDSNQSVGCPYLWNRTAELEHLKLHVFGHIHGSYGVSRGSKTTWVNASSVNENYDVTNAPIIIDL